MVGTCASISEGSRSAISSTGGGSVLQCAPKKAPAGAPFDRVLLDAPYSGSGVAGGWLLAGRSGGDGSRVGSSNCLDDDDGDASDAIWSADGLSRHARRQKALLWNACVLLRPGGALIYSTCSLSPEENEDVVQVGYK